MMKGHKLLSFETNTILVVDLDGTLLRSDMLYESFWSAFGRDWRSPLRAVAALLRGKAFLKRTLAEAAVIEVSTLPYDAKVIAYIQAWRYAGASDCRSSRHFRRSAWI